MTFDEAVRLLRAVGLLVQVGQGPELVAAADAEDAPGALSAQGVQTVYSFGFSLRQIEATWFLHVSPPTPAEQFGQLDDAVSRGLEIFRRYRDGHSPREYCDQFATFVAGDPCPVVERALVEAGWLPSQDHLDELGLSYLGSAKFSVHFPEEKRIVIVSVDQSGDRTWRLAVRCYREAHSRSSGSMPSRSSDRDGKVIADPAALSLSYRVAMALHGALAAVVSNERWALHGEPAEGTGSPEPIAPGLAD